MQGFQESGTLDILELTESESNFNKPFKTKAMKIIHLLVITLLASQVIAQNNTNKKSRFSLSGFEMSSSMDKFGLISMGFEDFKTIYGNNLPEINLTGNEYFFFNTEYPHYFYSLNPNSMIRIANTRNSLYAGAIFQINKKDGSNYWGNPTLRLRLNYTGNINHSGGISESFRYDYDTMHIVFQNQNQTIEIDSVFRRGIYYGINSNRLRLQADVFWKTPEFSRFSFYGGFGIGVGTSVKSTMSYSYSESFSILKDNTITKETVTFTESENKKGPSIIDFRLNAIMGVQFRTGKKGFFEKMIVFSEFSPQLILTKIGSAPSYWNNGVINSLGLRYTM
jgi:hypothetical protein